MHSLRSARHLARLVLAWFALALLVAIAAPLAQAESLELVCNGAGGAKLLVHGEDGTHEAFGHAPDCQLCASMAGPPPVLRLAVEAPTPLAHALLPAVAAHIAWLTAAPLPARGPPSLS
jgi:hypothetical protein